MIFDGRDWIGRSEIILEIVVNWKGIGKGGRKSGWDKLDEFLDGVELFNAYIYGKTARNLYWT